MPATFFQLGLFVTTAFTYQDLRNFQTDTHMMLFTHGQAQGTISWEERNIHLHTVGIVNDLSVPC